MTGFAAGRARMAAAVAGIAGLVLLAVLPPSLPAYVVIVLTECLIYAMAAASLDLLIGYTGMASLGHAAFFAVGAYTTALLTTRSGASFAVALAASILLAAAASAAVGVLILRASGIYFMMITLSVSMCAWGLAYRWVSLTGGDTGIVSIPRPRLGFVAGGLEFYYATLVLFSVCLTLYLLLVWSPFGKTLVGIRDSESRMRVLGFNVWLHKYLALVIAGAFAGLAGSLYAYYNGFVGPNTVDLAHAMQFVLMVIVGGPGTLVGPVIGAFIVALLEKVVSIFTERWVMVLAAVYVVTALWAPQGLLGVLGVVRR